MKLQKLKERRDTLMKELERQSEFAGIRMGVFARMKELERRIDSLDERIAEREEKEPENGK